MNKSSKLVLIRHGESLWNQENRFTGWVDVDLAAKGIEEAKRAGVLLRSEGYEFDQVHTSLLKRAIRTANILLDEMDLLWLPVYRSWRLNERHYGALQGLNKLETVEKHGEKQVQIWRRSYDIPPPALSKDDKTNPALHRRYREMTSFQTPLTESLKDTVARVVPYWHEKLQPALQKGERCLIVAHGNSLRALIKHLENISDSEIAEMNIPTGIPLLYELDSDFRPTNKKYLGDAADIEKAIGKVASQLKK